MPRQRGFDFRQVVGVQQVIVVEEADEIPAGVGDAGVARDVDAPGGAERDVDAAVGFDQRAGRLGRVLLRVRRGTDEPAEEGSVHRALDTVPETRQFRARSAPALRA